MFIECGPGKPENLRPHKVVKLGEKFNLFDPVNTYGASHKYRKEPQYHSSILLEIPGFPPFAVSLSTMVIMNIVDHTKVDGDVITLSNLSEGYNFTSEDAHLQSRIEKVSQSRKSLIPFEIAGSHLYADISPLDLEKVGLAQRIDDPENHWRYRLDEEFRKEFEGLRLQIFTERGSLIADIESRHEYLVNEIWHFYPDDFGPAADANKGNHLGVGTNEEEIANLQAKFIVVPKSTSRQR